ncbi:MAG: hypothetical protein U1E65_34105 [Myxococcota bacterium]
MLKQTAFILATFSLAAVVRVTSIDPQFEQRQTTRVATDFLASPGPVWLDAATFEHRLAVADLTWLSIVQDLSAKSNDADWDRVIRWTNIATDLDRLYFTVYHSVAICLTIYAKRFETSDEVLLKGRANLPQRWELPFVLGFNSYFGRRDADTGSQWMETAARLPQAPAYVAALSGRMRFQAGDEDAAMQMLEQMASQLDEQGRANVEERLKFLKTERRFRAYDEACKKFKEANGRLPREPAELQILGLVREPPFDFFDGPLSLDENCRATSKIVFVREEDAKKRSFKAIHELGGG